MKFTSTRNTALSVPSAQAIVQGISEEGGLFVPESFPQLSLEEILEFAKHSYPECAARVMGLYLTDFSREELLQMAKEAYASFDSEQVVPLARLCENESVLELFHGPTLAFKDVALQMLPRLMAASIQKTGAKHKVLILVATSGDTGKAALEGFQDVPGTGILVFFPQDGVSDMQKLQMLTQRGENVAVCAVEGNFDDAQTGVKRLFASGEVKERLAREGWQLSSANSINWGRLVPQIVYYFWAYSCLVKEGGAKPGEAVDFVVPTGNFGDILAGYYAKRMGLPVGRLVCASNDNKVLSDFFATGVYDRRREFYKTESPSMDILISSNLERLLFEASGRNAEVVAGWMASLAKEGVYDVGGEVLAALRADFDAGWSDGAHARAALARAFAEHRYVMDTHTAVAQAVAEEKASGAPFVVLSTASPYKFPAAVLKALCPQEDHPDAFEAAGALAALQAAAAGKAPEACLPEKIRELSSLPVRHDAVCAPNGMDEALYAALGRIAGKKATN